TTIQPAGVFQVVTRTFVPGSYARSDGWLIPYGPTRKNPASRSSRLANTLGESNAGTHSQSTAPSGATSAPVWQLDRKAYSAIGGNGDGAAALCTCGSASAARLRFVGVLTALIHASLVGPAAVSPAGSKVGRTAGLSITPTGRCRN